MNYIPWQDANKDSVKTYREEHECSVFEAIATVKKDYFLEHVKNADTLEDLRAVLYDVVRNSRFG